MDGWIDGWTDGWTDGWMDGHKYTESGITNFTEQCSCLSAPLIAVGTPVLPPPHFVCLSVSVCVCLSVCLCVCVCVCVCVDSLVLDPPTYTKPRLTSAFLYCLISFRLITCATSLRLPDTITGCGLFVARCVYKLPIPIVVTVAMVTDIYLVFWSIPAQICI